MQYNFDNLSLPAPVFVLLRDLIHERIGLYYDEEKRDLLADKLSPLVIERGFASMLDYYYVLKYDEEGDEEWHKVVNALSVQETYFWREIDQIEALVTNLVPKFFARYANSTLRIWCAACATGEEALTIAMMLDYSGWFRRGPIELLASDASSAAIAKARHGLYRERSLKNLPQHMRARYFAVQDRQWRIAPELHERIRWCQANLVNEQEIDELARATVIFCRNVFIYFSPQSIQRTVKLFYQRMNAPGYLFIGASESLLRFATNYHLEELGGAFVYVKKAEIY